MTDPATSEADRRDPGHASKPFNPRRLTRFIQSRIGVASYGILRVVVIMFAALLPLQVAPVAATGSEEERLAAFRRARDQIAEHVKDLTAGA